MHPQQQSPLLQLPTELQLVIFEYAVQDPEPLLLNCACDSSYNRDYERWGEDQAAWNAGELRAPEQPSLTRTCVLIREIALPMFYKLNVFRAHYCYQADRDGAVKWLEQIGAANRSMMRDICFIDMNESFDESVPRDLMQLKRSKLVKEMKGKIETIEAEDCCCHRLTFGPAVEDDFEGVAELFAS